MATLHADKILRVKNVSISSLVLLVIGIIGKIFNLSGTGYFLGCSIASTSYLFILIALEYSKTSNPNPQRVLLSRLCYGTFFLALIGVIILFLRISGIASSLLALGLWMFRFSGLLFSYVCFNHYSRLINAGKDGKARLEGLILMVASAGYLIIIVMVIISAAFGIKNIGALLIELSLLLTVIVIIPLIFLKAWFRNVILTTLIIFNTSITIFYFSDDEVAKLFHKVHSEEIALPPADK